MLMYHRLRVEVLPWNSCKAPGRAHPEGALLGPPPWIRRRPLDRGDLGVDPGARRCALHLPAPDAATRLGFLELGDLRQGPPGTVLRADTGRTQAAFR